jgi:uncharacterized membrane protein
MGPDEQQPQPPHEQAQATADLASLSARVEALERQLAELQSRHPSDLQSPQLTTPPPPKPPTTPAQTATPKASLEDRIGSQLFSRIGIVALLIAITLFLKWAIDNHWIGPTGRVLAGLIAGAAVVLWSERFRRQGFQPFAYALKAIGTGALYLSLWAAFQLYHLLPAPIALGAMILVTAWNAFMAWSQDSELLAAYALAGAFATPALLSTGGNHEIFLFTYLLAIDIATVILVRLKPWPRLLLGAFPATVAYFIVWYVTWFNIDRSNQPVAITEFSLTLFFLAFTIPSLSPRREESTLYSSITEILLPLANATFIALALYSVLEDAGHHPILAWIAVLLAAIYLGLMRLPQSTVTRAVHLALAVVFLTIAIPLEASGRWITIGWLAEGVALLWASAHLASSTPESRTSTSILRRLSILALALGLCGLLIQPLWFYPAVETAFINSRFATALAGLTAFALSTIIALRTSRIGSLNNDPTAQPATSSPNWLTIAACSVIAFNLTAILAFVRELDTIWRGTVNHDADLQNSLAISAFLLLYGAILLALGFWKRSAFLRWQALILLVFTIGKAFLYDLRNLSQGYGVLSFLGLGALLMAISFAYQKDWLALREPQPSHTEDSKAGVQ